MTSDPPQAPGPLASAVDDIIQWVLQEGLYGAHYDALLPDFCAKIVQAGIPLARVNFTMRTHHPRIGAFAYRWRRESGVHRENIERTAALNTEWETSPLKALLDSPDTEMRHRLHPVPEVIPFPMFHGLIAEGATDYFSTQVPFTRGSTQLMADERNMPAGMIISWTSDGPNGFSDGDLDAIRRILPSLALALKSASNRDMAEDLLAAYLGGDAGARVLSGAIERGSVETIKTAILYFDLQGFTKLSEALVPETLIDMLNVYFGAVVACVEAHDGNVLKFMGDGLLAIFNETGNGESRLAAIDAVTHIRDEVARINTDREAQSLPTTGFNAAIHSGEVLYGNIGAPTRLDFTVIGPAVNAASRILGMCSALDQQILISALVAKPVLDERPALVSVGQYRLRGVRERQELFTLD